MSRLLLRRGLATAPRWALAQQRALELAPGVAMAGITMRAGFLGADVLGRQLMALQGIEMAASPISGIPVAILLGLGLNNIALSAMDPAVSKRLAPGLTFCTRPVLQLGIVCVGSKLSLVDLFTAGALGIPIVAASVGAGLLLIPKLGKALDLDPKMTTLITAGTSICGVTAITAVAPAIAADQRSANFAIANVVAFGTLGMLAYPYLMHSLSVAHILPTSQQVGIALGLAVHDTSQVMGSALTYATLYNDQAVVAAAAVTKLSRNICLAGVIPYFALKHNASANEGYSLASFRKHTPNFVIGFVFASSLRTVGDLAGLNETIPLWKDAFALAGGSASTMLLGTAMAAVGLTTKLSVLKGVGFKPFLCGGGAAMIVGGTALIGCVALNAVL